MDPSDARGATRRGLLRSSAGLSFGLALGAAGLATESRGRPTAPATGDTDPWRAGIPSGVAGPPFGLGVASGDPAPDSVVLWTRLTRDPFEAASMGGEPLAVEWQVAGDPSFRAVAAEGRTWAEPAWGHSVHVDVGGLRPGRDYWYRFRALGAISPVGRTSTAPHPRARVGRLSLAVASCQNWQHGYYPVHDHIAADDVDAVLFLGDYIYEADPSTRAVRQHNPPAAVGGNELSTLDDFRRRYALYKSDPSLQAAHAAHPWIVTWDDHEVRNNYDAGADELLWTRAAAYQAYYEHLPLRPRPAFGASEYRIYRSLRFGSLLTLLVLDARQYRRHPPSQRSSGPPDVGRRNVRGSMLGDEQERWLLGELSGARTRWKALGQQVLMARALLDGRVNYDCWDGFGPQRTRILRGAADGAGTNLVVLSGDMHQTWVNDLLVDFDRPDSTVVGSEFVTPAVSSRYGRADHDPAAEFVAQNAHVRHVHSGHRGYLHCEVTPERWLTESRYVVTVEQPFSPLAPRAPGDRWVVQAGRPGVVPA